MSNTIERQVLDLGTLPTKGVDYWTPEEAEAMNKAKEDARNAASEANTEAKAAAIASKKATDAAKAANDAAASVDESKEAAIAAAAYAKNTADDSASAANNAAINANQAAANGNTQYNVLKNYHDNVTVPDHNRAEQDHDRANTDHSTAVSDHQTANTDHTNVTTNWRKEFTDAQDARAAEFNRTQQEKQTEFDRTQAEKQAVFDADHNRAENDHNTLAGGIAVQLQQLIGPYSKHVVIPLTASYATGKVLVVNPATGMVELTEKAGWGVTRLTAEALKAQHVDQGDTAFVYMLDSEGQNLMEEGIKVFVIETEVRGEDGQVIRRTLTSKFNAPNADVTLSGHLQTGYDLQPDQNLLICHPLSTASVEFLRTAEGAKEATTKLNLTQQMEKLATKEGVFLQMIAGLAEGIWDTNPESGNAREWLVGRPVIGCPDLVIPRMNDIDARSGQNKDIVVDKVAGGCVGGNQMVKDPMLNSPVVRQGTINRAEDIITLKPAETPTEIPMIASDANVVTSGHKYMMMCCVRPKSTYTSDMYFGNMNSNGYGTSGTISVIRPTVGQFNGICIIGTIPQTANFSLVGLRYYPFGGGRTMAEIDVKGGITSLDLTTLFPLDQTFVTDLYFGTNAALQAEACSRVLTRLGIIALDD